VPMHLRSRNDGLPPSEHASPADDARFVATVLTPDEAQGRVADILRLQENTLARHVRGTEKRRPATTPSPDRDRFRTKGDARSY
jgi:hypothetical protein